MKLRQDISHYVLTADGNQPKISVYIKNVMVFLILSFLSLKRLEYVFVILLVKNKSIIVKLRLIVQLMGDATSLVCFTMFCEPFW